MNSCVYCISTTTAHDQPVSNISTYGDTQTDYSISIQQTSVTQMIKIEPAMRRRIAKTVRRTEWSMPSQFS